MAKRTVGRVSMPKNIPEFFALLKAVQAKHLAEGGNSPLKSAEDYDWNELAAIIARCEEQHKLAEEYKRKMEESYRQRDLDMPGLLDALNGAKLLLKGVYRKNPKKMGEWGFQVDDTKQAKKPSDQPE